jgi:hypothetical protein
MPSYFSGDMCSNKLIVNWSWPGLSAGAGDSKALADPQHDKSCQSAAGQPAAGSVATVL